MYRFLKQIVILVVLCLANSEAIAQSVTNEWISISSNSVFDILADTDLVIVRAPVILKANVRPEDINLKLFDVSLGNRHEMRLISAIKLLPLNPIDRIYSPSIQIQVNLQQIAYQGTYNVIFVATTKDMPDVYLNLIINIPAAILRPEGPVMVDCPGVLQTAYYKIIRPGFSNKSFDRAKLSLQEVSGKSRLTEIQIYSLGFSDANNRKIEGNLEFSEVPTSINPMGSASIKYKMTGKFPLGTVTGKIEINAPQLAVPFLIEFNIHKRNTPLLILLITIFGLFIGYMSRTWLQSKITDAENRLKVQDLLDQMDSDIATHEDRKFRDKIKKSKNVLSEELKKRTPKTIQGAIALAEQEIKTTLEELQTSRTAAMSLYQEFVGVVQPSWSVPEEIEQTLDIVKNELKSYDTLINRDNIYDAIDLINQLQNKLRSELEPLIKKWSNEMTANFQSLSSPELPISVTDKLSQVVKQLNTFLDLVTPISPNATMAEIKGSLLSIHNLRGRIQQVMKLLIVWLREAVKDVSEVYEVAQLEEKPLENLSSGLEEIFKKFESENNLEQAINSLVTRYIKDINNRWKDFFIPQINMTLPEEQNGLRMLLFKCDYVEIARKVIDIQPTVKETALGIQEGIPLGKDKFTKKEVTSPFLLMTSGQQNPATVVLTKVYRQYEMLKSTATSRYLTMKELSNLKLLQSLIVGSGIAGVGYLLYEPHFIGTVTEMIQIFFWAFGLDVTFNTLIDQTKSVKKIV
jgi:hypothetical protein